MRRTRTRWVGWVAPIPRSRNHCPSDVPSKVAAPARALPVPIPRGLWAFRPVELRLLPLLLRRHILPRRRGVPRLHRLLGYFHLPPRFCQVVDVLLGTLPMARQKVWSGGLGGEPPGKRSAAEETPYRRACLLYHRHSFAVFFVFLVSVLLRQERISGVVIDRDRGEIARQKKKT